MLTNGRGLPRVSDLNALTQLVTCRPGLYLRQSQGPDADLVERASMDYEARIEMPGLSVTTMDPEAWWSKPAIDWIARRVCKYAELSDIQGRYAWLLEGRRAGYGPDHEPLVVDILPVAWLDDAVIEEARAHYHAHFEVLVIRRSSGCANCSRRAQWETRSRSSYPSIRTDVENAGAIWED